MILTPTYHVMKMYVGHHDATLLPSQIEQGWNYSYEGNELPALSVSASKDSTDIIHVTLTNIDYHKGTDLTLELKGLGKKLSQRSYQGKHISLIQ